MWVKRTNEQVSALLAETIKTLCRNTLGMKGDVMIEGLLGITVNTNEVLLVNIKELVRCKRPLPDSSDDGEAIAVSSVSKSLSIHKRPRSCNSCGITSSSIPANSRSSVDNAVNPPANISKVPEASTSIFSNTAIKQESDVVIVSPVAPAAGSSIQCNIAVTSNVDVMSPDVQTPGTTNMTESTGQDKRSERFQTEITMVHYPSSSYPMFQNQNKADKEENYHETYIEAGSFQVDMEENDDYLLDETGDEQTDDCKATDSSATSDPSQVTINDDPSKPPAQGYVCSFCSKKFKYKSNLKKHCVQVHNIPHLYKCPFCDQYAVNRQLLKQHILTHQESRPVKCGICGRTFPTQNHLKRHLLTPNVHKHSLPRLMQQ